MSTSRPIPPPSEALLHALRRLLRPLIRLLMQSGVTFPAVVDLLRGLYVDVAVHDLLTDERVRTDSRISLLTGVHRKEIRRLRLSTPGLDQSPRALTITSQIVARWLVSPWCGADGVPLPLPRVGGAGTLSFERLVETVTTDIRPRAVLDDLVTQGAISVMDDTVRLEVGGFVPRQGSAEQLFYFARNLHDHIAAAVANIVAPGPAPFVDRSVHYDRLTEAAASRIEASARESARDMLVEINRLAASEADADAHAGEPGQTAQRRVNIGVYLYVDDEMSGETGPARASPVH